jgi:hypothetical protein
MKKENIINLDKIIHKMTYVVNESPKYTAVMGEDNDFDNFPDELYEESNEEDDAQKGLKPNANVPPIESPEQVAPEDQAMPPEDGSPEQVAPEDQVTPDMGGMPPIAAPMAEPEQDVNSLQNEIIKSNVIAMKAIHDQMEELNNFVSKINGKLDILDTDVAEVREPTNSEKLMSKSKVSYPYYFNLNDFWSDSWFDKNNQDKGIKQLEDGTYVANFDDLPEDDDIKASLNRLT